MICGKDRTNTMPKLFFPKKHKKICVYQKIIVLLQREFTQPQSIAEYIKQANIYSTYNKDNGIGNKNYWTPTTISPYNLISIIGKLK